MAGLLDYVNRAGRGLYGILDRMATPNIAEDPAMLEMMTPEQRKAAAQQARSAGIYAMQKAAAGGAPWHALSQVQDVNAQPAYNAYVQNAVQSVEELRKRRDDDGRRTRIAETVARITNPEDPLAQKYTPEQRAVLGSLTPDQQAEILMKTEFPKQAGVSVATAGTVQGRAYKLPNGNRGWDVQTGDLEKPVITFDTGVPYVQDDPSEILTRERLLMDPRLIDIKGQDARTTVEGQEAGKTQMEFLRTAPQALYGALTNRDKLVAMRDRVAAAGTGKLTGPALVLFQSEMQALESELAEQALFLIGELKAAGVSLQPVSNEEFEFLKKPGAQITNNGAANLKIIDRRIKAIDELVRGLQEQLDFVDAGGDISRWRPKRRDQPAPAPAASPSAAPPAQRAPSKLPTLD